MLASSIVFAASVLLANAHESNVSPACTDETKTQLSGEGFTGPQVETAFNLFCSGVTADTQQKITIANLPSILDKHNDWLAGKSGGERADLRRADLTGADLRGADLRGAYLRRVDLTGADLFRAALRGADLRGANLRGADLTGAKLTGADLTGADLTGAILRGADLRGANLSGADLRAADLTGVVVDYVSLKDETDKWEGADLREVRLYKDGRIVSVAESALIIAEILKE